MTRKFNYILFSILFVLSGCGNNGNGEDVIPSEYQLHFFGAHGVGFYYNPPTLVNNCIYIGTSRSITYTAAQSNYFYRLDANLNLLWEFPLGNFQVLGAASLDSDDNIYFIADSGRTGSYSFARLYLYSLDNAGNFRWKFPISDLNPESGMMNVAISSNNTIYAGGVNQFYAFSQDGTVMWTYAYSQNDGPVRSAPIIDPSGNIYFSAHHTIYSLDASGNERWSYLTGGNSGSSPAFNTDYTAVIFVDYNSVMNFDANSGLLNWELDFPITEDLRSSPAVDNNNIIYIGSHGDGFENDQSTLYAIKADGSGILWQNNIGSDLYSSPALGNDGNLFIGSEGHGNTNDKHNRFHVVRRSDGVIVWSAELDMDVTWSSPAIADDGTLYISTMDINGEKSGVYSFATYSGGLLDNAGWPRFHGGNASTGRRQ